MKRIGKIAGCLLFSTLLVTGCNTMEGFGEDVEEGGEEIQEEA